MAAVNDFWIGTWNGMLHGIASGDPQGRPLLFVHGITECARSFVPVMNRLPDGYRAMALDLRGRGQSFKPLGGYRLRDYAEDLHAVWNLFSGGAGRPILIGHSLGGRIAAAFAAANSELVGGVVLVDPPVSGPGRRPFPLPESRFTGPKRAALEGKWQLFDSYYEGSGIDPEQKREEMRQCALQAIVESYRSMNEEPFHAYFGALRIPTLLLAAGASPFITDGELGELAELNPRALVKRIPDVGHEMHKFAPDLLVREIVEFVERCEREEAGR